MTGITELGTEVLCPFVAPSLSTPILLPLKEHKKPTFFFFFLLNSPFYLLVVPIISKILS